MYVSELFLSLSMFPLNLSLHCICTAFSCQREKFIQLFNYRLQLSTCYFTVRNEGKNSKNILYLVIATPQCVHNSDFQLSVSCGKFSGYITLVIVLLVVLSHLMPMQASFSSNAHGAFLSFSQCSSSELTQVSLQLNEALEQFLLFLQSFAKCLQEQHQDHLSLFLFFR